MKLHITSEDPIEVTQDGHPVMSVRIDDDSLPVVYMRAGIPGLPGPIGLSAYQIAVLNGFTGTEAEWLVSLQGPPGLGDMNKSVYDQNNDGIVDDSEKLVGYTLTALPLNGGYF